MSPDMECSQDQNRVLPEKGHSATTYLCKYFFRGSNEKSPIKNKQTQYKNKKGQVWNLLEAHVLSRGTGKFL